MLRLRRRNREEHTEWLRWLPSEIWAVPALLLLGPPAYAIYLMGHQRLSVGSLIMAVWLVGFGFASWWLHNHRYFHFGVAVACALGVMACAVLFNTVV